MRRAALAGVETIEHGYGGTAEVFKLMAERGVAFFPTLTAEEAYSEYFQGYTRGSEPLTADMQNVLRAVRAAREAAWSSAAAATSACSRTARTRASSSGW